MNLFNKEQFEIIEQFEKTYPYIRKDKEPKKLWKKKIIYQDGQVNELFIAFCFGVAYGEFCARR